MSILDLNRRFFEFLVLVLLLMPPLSFVVFATLGGFFNFNSFNFVIYIAFIIQSLSFMIVIKRAHAKFLGGFILILVLCLGGHVKNLGGGGVVDFLQTISGYYVFIFIGWLMYKLYFETGKVERLLKLMVRAGLFITVVNLLHYVYIATDEYTHFEWTLTFQHYQTMVNYLVELNKSFYDYIIIGLNYDNALRPVGFFYDTHAQYYYPLITGVILLFNKNLIKYRVAWIALIVVAIILSSIKTAVLSIVLLVFIWLLVSGKAKEMFKFIIPGMILVLVLFPSRIAAIFLGENITNILVQLFMHLVFVPISYFSSDPISFVFGGAPYLRNDPMFYSEVFWVTVTFYIGVLGLILYLAPLKLMRYIKRPEWQMGAYIYLVMALSLTHYGVFVVGVNNVATALPFMYFFALISKSKKERLLENKK